MFSMNSIISEIEFKTTTDQFFKKNKIGTMMRQSNFNKEQGFSCIVVLKFLFDLIFTGKNLYAYMENDRSKKPFGKDVIYRFLDSSKNNWRKLLLMLSSKIVAFVSQLTFECRENVIIIDDSFYGRERSKKVELLANVHDHTDGKYKRGFRLLTAAWSDGNTLIPLAFSLLSSSNKKNRYNEIDDTVDKRSNGTKRRKEAVSNSPDVAIRLLQEIKDHKIQAKTVLFDSWFSFPKMIATVVDEGFQVIAMLKNTPKIHYLHNGQKFTLSAIYKNLKKRRGKAKILSSVEVSIEQNGKVIPVKIVFVRNKNKKKDWLALISTDINLADEEIVRIYGKRWDIEVFFKMTKSYLALAKEFQCRSYDSMIAHTSIVFIRYTMLALANRENKDYRSFGELFYLCHDELQDISFSEAIQLMFKYLVNFLKDKFYLPNELIDMFLDYFINALPSHIKRRLFFLRCES